ncbi:MAG: hypothetical protein NZ840_11900, partial [Anaerolineales bacterium]|nr:hypothetical protein [Anaerolineales bacterium]MDW8162738.1 hypothetical protein [Anaerolineales bacterium]
QILKTFQYGLGDTRRPINEVTLADWAAIVAALFKAALSGAILTNTQPQIRQWDNKAKIIDHDFRWRILRVNFDVLALYAKAVKIADLLGYQRAIDQACEQVKSLIEEEYPLGNEVYRDSTGIYFTFPDLDLFTDLAQEIRRLLEQVEPELSPRIAVTVGDGQKAAEQLKGILAKARCEALRDLGQPFDTANFTSYWQQLWENPGLEQNWELCPVCRLRPMSEGNEACEHCLKRRGSRVKEWQSDPRYTIWIDELADANGRVALLVGKFGLEDWLSGELVQTLLVAAKANEPIGCVPKNPSPARLRRIWETCQRFWMDTVENQILNGLPDRTRWLLEVEQKASLPPPGVVCDGTFNGDPISVWHFGDAFLTISFVPEQPKPGLLSLTREDDGRKSQVQYRVRRVVAPSKQYSRYRPILTMLASPDQFLAFVPAADALEIVEQIRGEYEKQFGKVQNRLPLFFGIVFFPRKMPLVAVIDAAQRMLETPLVMEEWRVEYCCPDSQGLDQHVSLSRGGERIFWKIATKMGDNQTDDLWYPYFFVIHFADGTPDDRSYRFQHNGHWLVHVKELKEGDVVSIAPSRFAYLWLDHTAKRFEFDPQRDAMLLSELSHLSKMWDGIRSIPEMTDTQLHDISALFEVKSTLWQRESREFQNLVHATLKRAGMLDVISIEDVSSGRFVRCLELYVRILKRKIKN